MTMEISMFCPGCSKVLVLRRTGDPQGDTELRRVSGLGSGVLDVASGIQMGVSIND